MATIFLRKKRKKEFWVKYILSILHLWLGLVSSLILVLVSFTGCLYVFKNQIEYAFSTQPQSNQEQVINVQKAYRTFESNFGRPTQIIIRSADQAIELSSASKQNKGDYVYLDPVNGQVLSMRSNFLASFFDITLELHRWFLIENPGKIIVGTAVLMFVFQLLSGLMMWIPKKAKDLKKSLTVKWKAKFYRLNYDLHKVVGFYAIPLLLLISLTGLYVSFHWVKNLSIQALGGPSLSLDEQENNEMKAILSSEFEGLFKDMVNKRQKVQEEKSIQYLYDLVKNKYKDEHKIIIRIPESKEGYFVFRVMGSTFLTQSCPDEISVSSSGEIKDEVRFEEMQLYKQFMAIAKPLHTGEIFGLTSIVLYFVISLVACMLPITGFIIWFKKARF